MQDAYLHCISALVLISRVLLSQDIEKKHVCFDSLHIVHFFAHFNVRQEFEGLDGQYFKFL